MLQNQILTHLYKMQYCLAWIWYWLL